MAALALTADDHLVLEATVGNRAWWYAINVTCRRAGRPRTLSLVAADTPLLDVSALDGMGLPALERAIVQQVLGQEPSRVKTRCC